MGGTFDPIHLGHLKVAEAVRFALGLDEILFVPALAPPHRHEEPVASPCHRFAMIALATRATPAFLASDLEIRRGGPSYTVDTLRGLHAQGHDPLQLFFVTGADAFAEIATWHEYPGFLNLAHFVVCARPGFPAALARHRMPDLAPRMIDAPRDGRAPGQEPIPRIWLLDVDTPAISSTDVRARAHDGRPLAGLVPPDVEHHICRYGLYGAGPAAD